MEVTKTQAIKNFLLNTETPDDLAQLYSHDMECQVNVAQGDGERIDGDFKGRRWHGYSNGIETWKPFRIPWNAKSEPEYKDTKMKFDLVTHAEGIGMTGWNWVKRVSQWVAFDFDAITGHSDKHGSKLTPQELEEVKAAAMGIEWITIRKSTSGKGLHLYVFIDDVPTANHTEHAALARAILGQLSAITGFDFQSKIDACGGNMWVWHRKLSGTDGLQIIKQGSALKEIPPNWKEHLQVVSGKRKRVRPAWVTDQMEESFDQLTGQRSKVDFDEDHKNLITWLMEHNCQWWWDEDSKMLITHTIHLQEAHEALKFKGIFKTKSEGRDKGADHNCFCFAISRGAWIVRRYTKGLKEDASWTQDGQGWTKCYLNREPDLAAAAATFAGIEIENGSFVFQNSENAQKTANLLGADLRLPGWTVGRETTIKQHRDGQRIVVTLEHKPTDNNIPGWHFDKKKGGTWNKIFRVTNSEPEDAELGNYDEFSRHLVSESGEDCGWVIKSGIQWRNEPFIHVKTALTASGLNPKEVQKVMGSSIMQAWVLVTRPFQPEYIGNRQWNRDAPQLRFVPTQDTDNLKYDHWLKILKHCGGGLDDAVAHNGWCRANSIKSGADYLKCWIASLLQEPMEPLPYLFLYGPQGSGKSILHEAIRLLITKGYIRSDSALTNASSFNGELENSVLCVVEEVNLQKSSLALNRIKDWVTSIEISIHKKRRTPYHVPNTTHWIQCANDYSFCPIFSGDTRITMVYVDALDPMNQIPKKKMLPLLEKEAPDFLAELLTLELPESNDRLNVPVVTTEEKIQAAQLNRSLLEIFLDEQCFYVPGSIVLLSDFYDKFRAWLEPEYVCEWSKIRIGKELPKKFPKGRLPKTGDHYYGNIAFDDSPGTSKLVVRGKYLVREDGKEILP